MGRHGPALGPWDETLATAWLCILIPTPPAPRPAPSPHHLPAGPWCRAQGGRPPPTAGFPLPPTQHRDSRHRAPSWAGGCLTGGGCCQCCRVPPQQVPPASPSWLGAPPPHFPCIQWPVSQVSLEASGNLTKFPASPRPPPPGLPWDARREEGSQGAPEDRF